MELRSILRGQAVLSTLKLNLKDLESSHVLCLIWCWSELQVSS